jgi:DNA-binding NtrC family response regulator
MEHFDNHKERAAAALGVSLKTLYNRLKLYAGETGDGEAPADQERETSTR